MFPSRIFHTSITRSQRRENSERERRVKRVLENVMTIMRKERIIREKKVMKRARRGVKSSYSLRPRVS